MAIAFFIIKFQPCVAITEKYAMCNAYLLIHLYNRTGNYMKKEYVKYFRYTNSVINENTKV